VDGYKSIVLVKLKHITGMKAPVNLFCAQSVEQIIRNAGSTPATIALIAGKIHVGLSAAELEMVADPDNFKTAVKTSRRDIAPVLAQKRLGGTTVAGTMYIASTVGIPIFVTGGIGGVHRGGETSKANLCRMGSI
jgi:pseudouridine-5'-phosphate glycosidase/pseudouridine kinase